MWAAERISSDKAEQWEAGLTASLPGEPLEVADEEFDDSYDQIKQQ